MKEHPHAIAQSDENSQVAEYEKMYIKEHKKAIGFMLTSIILACLFVGTIIFVLSNTSTQQSKRELKNGGLPQIREGSGPGGMRMMFDIQEFLNDDGSIDISGIEQAKKEHTKRYLDMIKKQINSALDDGSITQDQADKLEKAFGI